MSMYYVTAFYHFQKFTKADLPALQEAMLKKCDAFGIQGLTLIAREGLNGTVAAKTETALAQWKGYLEELAPGISFKDSQSEKQPFKRNFVKIRDEIVQLGKTEIFPEGENNHITPDEWNRMMQEEDVVVIDVRNDYEIEVGTFKGAVDPKTKTFKEFPEFVKHCDIPKDKKVLMCCTGGIRCEKASIEMQQQGYQHVYQLKGGILQYIKEHPNEFFEGECFIFDHRAAVNQQLQASERYALCPHCGDPGDVRIACNRCNEKCAICKRCKAFSERLSCSKDCANKIKQGIPTKNKKKTSALI